MNAAAALAVPPSRRRYSTPHERIQARVQLSDKTFYEGTPCWIWQGQVNIAGYGTLQMRAPGKRTPRKQLVHRYSIHIYHGIALAQIDFGMHLCNVRRCCCPTHLQNGSQSENEKYKVKTRGWVFDRHGNLYDPIYGPDPIVYGDAAHEVGFDGPNVVVNEREPGCDDE